MTLAKTHNRINPRFSILVIILAGLLAYSNSFFVPFVFDDKWNITGNPTVRHLWPVSDKFLSPAETGIAGRPLVILSFAVNYAISGESVWGYHALNVMIHILAGLAVFGIVRRTLSWSGFNPVYREASTGLALICALIFVLHPLQTQAVTYITQRLESLMGLCFLMTLYSSIRSWQASGNLTWQILAVVFFIAGVESKEVIVVAPAMVFLYDCVFVHEHPGQALLRSKFIYGGFLAGLMILFAMVISGRTAEWAYAGTPSATLPQYLSVQPSVIMHYLKLTLWPDQLCFDYGWPEDHVFKGLTLGGNNKFLAGISVVSLCALALFALWRRKPVGFLGGWFFGILAPTSSIVPLYSIAAEHRMYLPIIAVIVLVVIGGYWSGRYFSKNDPGRWRTVRNAELFFIVPVMVLLATLTFSRNRDYRSRVSLWADTVQKAPGNSRARQNLGSALVDENREAEGVLQYKEALRLRAGDVGTYVNLAIALDRLGRSAEATFYYRKALEINPENTTAHSNLGILLAQGNQLEQAILHFQKAVLLSPDHAAAHNNLGYAYYLEGRFQEATAHFEKALEIDPKFVTAEANLMLLNKRKKQEKGK